MFVVVGEALLDLVQPDPNGPFEAWPGGGPLNIAVGLHRLGHPTRLLARLSTGGLGDLVRRHLHDNGVDTRSCIDTDAPTTLAFVTLDESGRASYDFYVEGTADWGWTADELGRVAAECRVLHSGSLAAAISPGADAILDVFERRHREGRVILSFDPNIRPRLAGPRAGAVARVERFVAASHVVKASGEDLAWLYPELTIDQALVRWAGLGPTLVVATRGAEGSVAVTARGDLVDAPGEAVRLVDTIGAGDAFESGLLSGLADAGVDSPEALARLAPPDVASLLERAAVVAELTCERVGADPPTRQEYEDRVRRRASKPSRNASHRQ